MNDDLKSYRAFRAKRDGVEGCYVTRRDELNKLHRILFIEDEQAAQDIAHILNLSRSDRMAEKE